MKIEINIDKESFEPVYEQLKKQLLWNISNGTFSTGAKIPSVRKLKDISGLGHVTVARAVSELISEGILENHRGKGTFVAQQNFQPRKDLNIALIVNSSYGELDPVNTPAQYEIVSGINEYAAKAGCSIEIISVEDYLNGNWHKTPNGAIISQADGYPLICKKCEQIGIPLMKIIRYSSSPSMHYVDTDQYEAIYKLAEYLLDLGHSKIVLVKHRAHSDFTTRERIRGYCDALADHGVKLNDNLIVEGAQSFTAGHKLMTEMLSIELRPTAYIALCDISAAGAIRAVQDQGLKVPDDISITGYMGLTVMKNNMPRITTVDLHFHEIGRSAISNLLEIIRMPDIHHKPIQKIIHPELIIGETTARNPSVSS
jgi:DNA-binding LacI/PurR family transcriptional regulator